MQNHFSQEHVQAPRNFSWQSFDQDEQQDCGRKWELQVSSFDSSHPIFFSLLLFRVNRSKGAPIILNVIGVERTDVKFSVDLVPSFKFEICHLQIACPELHRRIVSLMKQNNISVKVLMQYIEAKINVLVFRISWPLRWIQIPVRCLRSTSMIWSEHCWLGSAGAWRRWSCWWSTTGTPRAALSPSCGPIFSRSWWRILSTNNWHYNLRPRWWIILCERSLVSGTTQI